MIKWICTIDDSAIVNTKAPTPQKAAENALSGGERAIYSGIGNVYQTMYFTGELTGRVVAVIPAAPLTQNQVGSIGRSIRPSLKRCNKGTDQR